MKTYCVEYPDGTCLGYICARQEAAVWRRLLEMAYDGALKFQGGGYRVTEVR